MKNLLLSILKLWIKCKTTKLLHDFYLFTNKLSYFINELLNYNEQMFLD